MAESTGILHEYRVVWQREGQARKRAVYQTQAGALACMERQRTAAAEMDWLPEPLKPLTFGPVLEERTVGPWGRLDTVIELG